MFVNWKYQQTYQTTDSLLEITIKDHHGNIPQQENGVDCGVFTMMYAKYIAAGQSFTFTKEDMERFRKRI